MTHREGSSAKDRRILSAQRRQTPRQSASRDTAPRDSSASVGNIATFCWISKLNLCVSFCSVAGWVISWIEKSWTSESMIRLVDWTLRWNVDLKQNSGGMLICEVLTFVVLTCWTLPDDFVINILFLGCQSIRLHCQSDLISEWLCFGFQWTVTSVSGCSTLVERPAMERRTTTRSPFVATRRGDWCQTSPALPTRMKTVALKVSVGYGQNISDQIFLLNWLSVNECSRVMMGDVALPLSFLFLLQPPFWLELRAVNLASGLDWGERQTRTMSTGGLITHPSRSSIGKERSLRWM